MKKQSKIVGALVLSLVFFIFMSCVSETPLQNEEMTQKSAFSANQVVEVKSTVLVNGFFPDDTRHAHLLSQQGLMSASAYMTPTPFKFNANGEVSYGNGASFYGFQQKLVSTLRVEGQDFRTYEVSFKTVAKGLKGTLVTSKRPLSEVKGPITELLILKALKESGAKNGQFAVREVTLVDDQEAQISLFLYK